jgi:hypothetical protein
MRNISNKKVVRFMILSKKLHPTTRDEMVDRNKTFSQVLNINLSEYNEYRCPVYTLSVPDKVIPMII